jgi:hypothetical protein
VALLALMVVAPAAFAHEGNINFLSEIEGVSPAIEGVEVGMINRDDRIRLDNRSGQDIVILGYEEGEQYARLKADGTVEVNKNAKAYYLNEDRFGTSEVPESLPSEPDWERVPGDHRFEWHDHRAHYMGKGTPPQVKDAGKRQKVFDWKVPLRAGNGTGAITGTLHWTPKPGDGTPLALIAGGGALALLLAAGGFVLMRRRRSGAAAPRGTGEAW